MTATAGINRNDLLDHHESTELSVKTPISFGARGIELRTFEDLWRFSTVVCKTDFVPKHFRGNPEATCIAIQYGHEVGLPPLAALQNIAVINGRPALWGDGQHSLCLNHPEFDHGRFKEWYEGEGDAKTAFCTVARKGCLPHTASFSMAEAKAAGLLGKDSPWRTYPARMLQWRARGFAERDVFADALRGLVSEAEAVDTPIDVAVVEPPKPLAAKVAEAAERLKTLPPKVVSEITKEATRRANDFVENMPRAAVAESEASQPVPEAATQPARASLESLEAIRLAAGPLLIKPATAKKILASHGVGPDLAGLDALAPEAAQALLIELQDARAAKA